METVDHLKEARQELASRIMEALNFDWDGPVTWGIVDAIDALIKVRLTDSAGEDNG